MLFEEFALTRHVAAVALRGDVFADALDGFTRDHAAADGGLQGDLKEVFGNYDKVKQGRSYTVAKAMKD